jgi:uncharacterized protein (DUF885 family)
MRHALTTLALLALSAVPAMAQDAPVDPTEQLHALFEDVWNRDMRDNPVEASENGDLRYNDRWPDLSVTAMRARHAANKADMKRLLEIEKDALSPLDRINYDLFRRNLQNRLDIVSFGREYLYQQSYSTPRNQREGIHTAYELAERLNFDDEQAYRDWIARLESFGTYVDQAIILYRQSITDRIVPPKIIIERIRDQVLTLFNVDPTYSPFYAPFLEMPADMPAALKTELKNAGRKAIMEVVIPAARRYGEFVIEQYLPAGRDTYGALYEPDGKTFYQNRVRYFTTTEMTPAEIHRLGLAEVERIRGEMEVIIDSLGFEGGFAAFLEFLRTDPQFYFEDPQDLFDAYEKAAKGIEPKLGRVFGRLPKIPFEVRPIPEAAAPHTTTAYYSRPSDDGSRPGYYYVNLYKPDSRPKYEIEVLSAHEAVPGHHLEVVLTMALGELPKFRRHEYLTAYSEGWALYSESLGEDLGLYQDPYSKFGQLTYDMWRAIRLVVDTGIHSMGWSRDRAITFFKENAAKSELDIVNEIDRYIAWPGQALAYKIGQLRIMALRAEAEEALGENFDIRAFHDQLLSQGPVTLKQLERNSRLWLAATRAEYAEQE